MDCENRVVEKLGALTAVLTADETLLVSLSNKGTVNRGKKDLDKMREEISFPPESQPDGDGLLVKIGGEAMVTLRKQLTDCTCDCPSMSVCRHIITAFFYCREYYANARETENGAVAEREKNVIENAEPLPASVVSEAFVQTDGKTSANVLMKKLADFSSVRSLDETLLVSLSNKGTVNRGKKDLDKMREEISFSPEFQPDGDGVLVKIGEEATVTVRKQAADCTCDCPSMSVCRHIVTALFYCKAYYEQNAGTAGDAGVTAVGSTSGARENPAVPEKTDCNSFPELNALLETGPSGECEGLKKLVGKKDYVTLVRAVRKKNEAVFLYGDFLQVQLKSQDVLVYFPKERSIEGSVCSCKASGYCRHKKYALVAYAMWERGLFLPLEEETRELTEKERDDLTQAAEQIAGYLDKGLSSLPREVVREMERRYIRTYDMKLYELANEFKLLSGELNAYFSRNIAFSNTRTMHLFCRAYNRIAALLRAAGNQSRQMLIGKKREESDTISELQATGLGMAVRITRRQDLFLSVYVYCEDLKEILMISTLRPVTPGESVSHLLSYLYDAGVFWEEELSASRIFSRRFVIKNATVTAGKLSGSKSSSCTLLEQTRPEDVERIAVDDFHSLKERLEERGYQYFQTYSETARIFLIKAADMGEATYNAVTQKLQMRIFDRSGFSILMEIPYDAVTEKAIKMLETEQTRPKFQYMLGSFSLRGGEVEGRFLSGMEDRRIIPLYIK